MAKLCIPTVQGVFWCCESQAVAENGFMATAPWASPVVVGWGGVGQWVGRARTGARIGAATEHVELSLFHTFSVPICLQFFPKPPLLMMTRDGGGSEDHCHPGVASIHFPWCPWPTKWQCTFPTVDLGLKLMDHKICQHKPWIGLGCGFMILCTRMPCRTQ